MIRKIRDIVLLENDNGSLFSFCSVLCMRNWARNSSFSIDPDREVFLGRVKSNYGTCMYCSDCGNILIDSINCHLHMDKCLKWSWMARINFMYEFVCYLEDYSMTDEDWIIAERIMNSAPTLEPFALSNLIRQS